MPVALHIKYRHFFQKKPCLTPLLSKSIYRIIYKYSYWLFSCVMYVWEVGCVHPQIYIWGNKVSAFEELLSSGIGHCFSLVEVYHIPEDNTLLSHFHEGLRYCIFQYSFHNSRLQKFISTFNVVILFLVLELLCQFR